jgi:sirohydrochlorin ferrochelatase
MKAILLIDHGSVEEAANRMLDAVEALVRAEVGPDVHVEIAHMELAEPSIAQGFDACVAAGANVVIAHPYMLSAGRHATRDIPRMVAGAAAKHPAVGYAVTGPLGIHESIARVIVERVEEAEKKR